MQLVELPAPLAMRELLSRRHNVVSKRLHSATLVRQRTRTLELRHAFARQAIGPTFVADGFTLTFVAAHACAPLHREAQQ
jgi:hypothetical protein